MDSQRVSPLAFFDQPCIRLLVLTPDYRDFLRLNSWAAASDDLAMSAAWCADTASFERAMAEKPFDMSVVAEGVETYAQMEFLRQLSCDLVQGYYFARPMPWGQLVQFLRNQRQSACL